MTTQPQTSTPNYIVYWAHLKEHSDITCEGYVGITSSPLALRISQHVCNARRRINSKNKTILDRAFHKHGKENIIFEKVCICSKEYALWLEKSLRPEMKIGWNIAAGGDGGGRFEGHRHTEEAKARISEAATGRKHTDSAKLKMSVARKTIKQVPFSEDRRKAVSERLKEEYKRNGPWAHRNSKSPAWKVLDKIFDAFSQGIVSKSSIRCFAQLPPEAEVDRAIKYVKVYGDPRLDQRWIDWMEKNN